MAKFNVGGPGSGNAGPPRINVQRDVEMTFMGSFHVEPTDNFPDPQHRFDWRLDDGPDLEDEDVGRIWSIYTNYPKPGKKPHPSSNLYAQLEAVSGGTFDPDNEEEIDTDQYIGHKYLGDFKDEPAKARQGNEFVIRKDENGRTMMKSKLVNIRPPRRENPARRRRSAPQPEPTQDEFDWDSDGN